jgi:hypothetical protein
MSYAHDVKSAGGVGGVGCCGVMNVQSSLAPVMPAVSSELVSGAPSPVHEYWQYLASFPEDPSNTGCPVQSVVIPPGMSLWTSGHVPVGLTAIW